MRDGVSIYSQNFLACDLYKNEIFRKNDNTITQETFL